MDLELISIGLGIIVTLVGLGWKIGTDCVKFGTYKHATTSIINLPVLSTSSERFVFESGFSDNRGGVPTDGVFIQYSDNINSGKFFGVCYNNNVATTVDLTITVAANTWYKLKTVVNADRSIDFYIDGTLRGSMISGTAPDGVGTAARATALGTTIRKAVGSTGRGVYIDYLNIQIDTAR